MNPLKELIEAVFKGTPFEIRRRLAKPNLEAIRLVLAHYRSAARPAVVLQIGACDGTSNDPIHEFLRNAKCRAIVVEPVKESFDKLSAAYEGNSNVTAFHAAVGHKDGVAKIYKVRQGAKSIDSYWGPQLASFDRKHLLKHKVKDDEIEEVNVPCRSLKSLAEQFRLERIDILQVDTEGFDAEIVRMALSLAVPPECINFEHVHLSTKCRDNVFSMLKASGYLWTHDRWNTLALRENCEDRWW